ncbi:MAG: DUF2971 domain-containing protein [Acidiferrobacteraceae bacterium]
MSTGEPAKLYHYFPLGSDNKGWFDRMCCTLSAHRLYCPSPKKLNDPFDCMVKMKNGDRSKEADIQERVNRRAGILSFATCNDHVPMWSHYANGHRGLCLEFDMEKWPRTERESNGCHLGSVEYCMERPLLTLSREELEKAKTLEKIAFTKHTDWGYEDEWRMVCSFMYPSNPYLLFPVAALTGAIFGLRMSPDDRRAIEEVIKNAKYNLTISEARENHDQFRVEIHPCPERG